MQKMIKKNFNSSLGEIKKGGKESKEQKKKRNIQC